MALRGNHEQELLDFLGDAEVLRNWSAHGGLATLASYGVDVGAVLSSAGEPGAGFAAARDALLQNLPPAHREFLEATRMSCFAGDYFFCHAGARPGVPLARQAPHDLMWIRDAFTDCREPLEKVIVHGHSPARAPVVLPHRIGIDTGAYVTGVLTCVVLEGRSGASSRHRIDASNASHPATASRFWLILI